MLRVKNRFWYFLIGMTWMVTFPFLRMSAMLSQPDWFGLIFGFSILLLTLDFRFEKLEPVRFCLLFLATQPSSSPAGGTYTLWWATTLPTQFWCW